MMQKFPLDFVKKGEGEILSLPATVRSRLDLWKQTLLVGLYPIEISKPSLRLLLGWVRAGLGAANRPYYNRGSW